MSNDLFYSALKVSICVCFIAYPYIANLIKISSKNRKIRKLKEEKRKLEEEIKKNKKVLEYLTKLYDLNNMTIKNLLKYQMATNFQQSLDKKEQ